MIPRQTLKALAAQRADKYRHEASADACLAEATRHMLAAQACEKTIDELLEQASANT